MQRDGYTSFNGLHLRLENDAVDWWRILGGKAVLWHDYVQAMRVANFTGSAGLYTASGLLTYDSNQGESMLDALS